MDSYTRVSDQYSNVELSWNKINDKELRGGGIISSDPECSCKCGSNRECGGGRWQALVAAIMSGGQVQRQLNGVGIFVNCYLIYAGITIFSSKHEYAPLSWSKSK